MDTMYQLVSIKKIKLYMRHAYFGELYDDVSLLVGIDEKKESRFSSSSSDGNTLVFDEFVWSSSDPADLALVFAPLGL
jgi:hypothetical protein